MAHSFRLLALTTTILLSVPTLKGLSSQSMRYKTRERTNTYDLYLPPMMDGHSSCQRRAVKTIYGSSTTSLKITQTGSATSSPSMILNIYPCMKSNENEQKESCPKTSSNKSTTPASTWALKVPTTPKALTACASKAKSPKSRGNQVSKSTPRGTLASGTRHNHLLPSHWTNDTHNRLL